MSRSLELATVVVLTPFVMTRERFWQKRCFPWSTSQAPSRFSMRHGRNCLPACLKTCATARIPDSAGQCQKILITQARPTEDHWLSHNLLQKPWCRTFV